MWPKQDENYEPGDYVVIHNQTALPVSSFRRRMPEGGGTDNVSLGIVTDKSHDGECTVVDIANGATRVVSVKDLAKLPKEKVSEIEATAPAFKQITQVVKELSKPASARGKYTPGHRVEVGSIIQFMGENYKISKGVHVSNGVSKIELTNDKGVRVAVPVGDDRLKDVWGDSTIVNSPGDYHSFSQFGTGFSRGELVWFPSHSYQGVYDELGCVFRCKGDRLLVFSAYNGIEHNVDASQCTEYDVLGGGNEYMAWRAAVAEGRERDIIEKSPGRIGQQEACFRTPRYKRIQPQYNDPDQNSEAGEEYRTEFHTNKQALERDAVKDYHDGMDNGVYGYPMGYGGGYGDHISYSGSTDVNGNSMMYILLASGAVLAFMFSR